VEQRSYDETLTAFQGKNILVTGGRGYIASCMVRLLQDIDCSLVRLVRPGAFLSPVTGRVKIQDIVGDVRQMEVWEEALRNIDIVFHFAAQTSAYEANRNPADDLQSNVTPMLYMLETCLRKGWKKVILFSSTVTIAGIPVFLPVNETHPDNPLTIYDLHKQMAENYLKYYIKQDVVKGAILRLANVYGPGPKSSHTDRGILNQMIRKAMAGEPLTIYGTGDQLRDYVYVEDVAWAFLKAAHAVESVNGRHFVIGSGQGFTIAQAVRLVSERVALKTGKAVPLVHVDAPSSLLAIEDRSFIADTGQFGEATAWKAHYTLVDGIDRTVERYL
jgi:nucleoside-diphosphate-sugar epimerase